MWGGCHSLRHSLVDLGLSVPYDDEDEAVAFANDSDYGLNEAVFTLLHNLVKAEWVVRMSEGVFGLGAKGPPVVVLDLDDTSNQSPTGSPSTPEYAMGLALDVIDPAQVTEVVARAEERFGRIDVLVNNAGYCYRAAVEEGDEADVRRLFDTNLFGAIAMIKLRCRACVLGAPERS